MQILREALRLALNTSLSNRQIGQMLGLSYNTVIRYRTLAREKDLPWSAIESMDDTALEHALRTARHRWSSKRLPDWAHVHQEMQLRDVTLQLLWEEYRLANPDDAYAYSQFTQLYRDFVGKLDLTANLSRFKTSSSSAMSAALENRLICSARAASSTAFGGPPHKNAERTVFVSTTTRTRQRCRLSDDALAPSAQRRSRRRSLFR